MPDPARRRLAIPFWAQIFLGLLVGVALGLIARSYDVDGLTTFLEILGGSFVTLLPTIVVPLVFLAIVVSVGRLRNILGLIGSAAVTYGWELVSPLAVFTFDVHLGCALVLFGVYPLLLRAHGLNPVKFFSGAWPALQLAFVSRSSVGTMPLTQYVTTRNLGVAPEYASFAVPLGATTKMDGCAAIYPSLAAIFVAQFFGIELGFTDYLLIAFVSVVGSAATAGLTGAVVMLTLTLTTQGLPLEGVGLLLVPTIVAKREGLHDQAAYDGERAGDPIGEAQPAAA